MKSSIPITNKTFDDVGWFSLYCCQDINIKATNHAKPLLRAKNKLKLISLKKYAIFTNATIIIKATIG